MTHMLAVRGPVVTRTQLSSTALGMEYLGGVVAAGGEASIVTPTFGARDSLMCVVGITGLSTAGHVTLRCNADAGLNYWHRTFSSSGVIAGLVSFTNTQPASAQGEIDLEGGSSTALERHWLVQFSNRLAMPKTAFWQGCVGASTLDPTVSILGAGEWVNTAAQITSLTLRPLAGTLNAGCRLQVYGREYP